MSDNHERIRQRAYEIWQERGEPESAHDEIWLEAEHEVLTAAADGSAIEGEESQSESGSDFDRSRKVGEAAARAVAGTDGPTEAVDSRTGRSHSHGEDPLVSC